MRAPVRLVRFLNFDGTRLHFTDSTGAAPPSTLPLASNYHSLASTLQSHQLCKATVLDGAIVILEAAARMP
jgi:hypothetical protein